MYQQPVDYQDKAGHLPLSSSKKRRYRNKKKRRYRNKGSRGREREKENKGKKERETFMLYFRILRTVLKIKIQIRSIRCVRCGCVYYAREFTYTRKSIYNCRDSATITLYDTMRPTKRRTLMSTMGTIHGCPNLVRIIRDMTMRTRCSILWRCVQTKQPATFCINISFASFILNHFISFTAPFPVSLHSSTHIRIHM